MIIEDFVMLGRTEPVESTKHGVTVCSAGYSVEWRKLVRVYPLPWPNNISAGTLCRMPLRRPRDDSREESWRINAGETAANALDAVEVLGQANRDNEYEFLKSLAVPSIKYANDNRMSLAIIEPRNMTWAYERRPDMDPAEQIVMFERRESESVVHQSDLVRRIGFEDEDGPHSLQLKDWGCNEWLRKDRFKPEQLWDNLRFTDKSYEHLLLVGNQKNRRTSWLVIRTISRRITTQQSFGFGF